LLPVGVSAWVPFLLQREWRNMMELRTVAAGRHRSFFVDANGALLACGEEGEEEQGLLGLREGPSQTPLTVVVPTPVPSMAGVRIRAVACHRFGNLALSEAGQVFAWGLQMEPSPDDGIVWGKWQPLVPTVIEGLRNHRVRQIAAVNGHCAAVTEDGVLFAVTDTGALYTWGENYSSKLGHGDVRVWDVPALVQGLHGIRVVAVSADFLHTLA
jgi:alpha-tubulin suppressor-like RCC1 family protein